MIRLDNKEIARALNIRLADINLENADKIAKAQLKKAVGELGHHISEIPLEDTYGFNAEILGLDRSVWQSLLKEVED